MSVLTAAILMAGAVAAGADPAGVLVSFRPGSSDTLPPDGKSQTVLVVNIDPTSPAWGGPVDLKSGHFRVDVTWYGRGKISPSSINPARFPAYITVTSWQLPKGVTKQRSAAVVNVTYTPPGDTTGRRAKTCKGSVYVTVASKRANPPAKSNKNAELIAAVRAGNIAAAKKLLAAGANPNVRDARHGWRPLHFAVVCSPAARNGTTAPAATIRTRRELIELLLAAGAIVNPRDKQLATPLHLAAVKGQTTEVVRLLLDRGADPTAKMRAFQDPKSAAVTTPAEVAGQAPRPWNQRIRDVLAGAVQDKGWKPAHEYANCHSYTIFMLTGQHLRKPVNDLQTVALEAVLRGQGYIPLPYRSKGMHLEDEVILGRLRHGDVLVIGDRHSASARQNAEGLRFYHFSGQTGYDARGNILSRSDLGRIKIDPSTGKRTYMPPGPAAVAGASPGAKLYEVHCSPRNGIASMARGIRQYGKDEVVIWRRLGPYRRGSWYLVADRSKFGSVSDTGRGDPEVRTFSLRFDVPGKFEDKPGLNGITFTGGRKLTDLSTGITQEAKMKAVFDDRLGKLLLLEISHSKDVPDRGGIQGSRMKLELKAKDIDVRRISDSAVFCRTATPAKQISDIKHTVHRGRWVTTLKEVGSGKVTWLEVTFDEDTFSAGP